MAELLVSQGEFVPITTMGRQLGEYLTKLRNHKKEKFIIVRNNVPEAVLLEIQSYETLTEIIEDLSTQLEIAKRMAKQHNHSKRITLEELGKRHGLK